MNRWTARWGALAACLAAFVLRVYRLGYQELRGDEAFGYFFSLQPFDEIARATLRLAEPHPVASYYLEKAWLGVAGESEFALRYASLWPSVLSVALLFLLARLLGLKRGTALLAAALIAVNPYMIWHAQDARMYGASLALTLASTCLAVVILHRPRPAPWLGYVFITWLALQTHYFNAFVILAQNVWAVMWLIVTRRSPRVLASWLAAGIAVALLYLPWLIAAAGILSGYGGNADSPGLGEMLLRSLSVFAVGESSPQGERIAAGAIAALFILIGTARLWLSGQQHRWTAALLLLYLGIPLTATWLSALNRPIFNERYLVAASPPSYLLFAVALTGARPGQRPVVSPRVKAAAPVLGAVFVGLLVLTALSLSRHYTDPAYGKTRGWRALAAKIALLSAGMPPEAVHIAQNFPDPTLWYYYRGPVPHVVLPPRPHDAAGAEATVTAMAESGVRRTILPVQPATWWDDSGIATAALDGAYRRIAEETVGVWPVESYVRPPGALETTEVPMRGGPVLAGVAVEPQEVVPGGLLAVYLKWTGAADFDGSEKITLQLIDHTGTLAAQLDQPFPASTVGGPTEAYGILVPDTVARGQYQVIAALYRPEGQGFARLLTEDGRDHIPLATVTVQ